MAERVEPGSHGLSFFAGAYGALIAAAALAAVIGNLWHGMLLNLYLAMRWNKWAFEAYAITVTLVLVLIWLVLVIVLEHRFSRAPNGVALRHRVVPVLASLAVLAAASYGISWMVAPAPLI